jgi:hypothetical protein
MRNLSLFIKKYCMGTYCQEFFRANRVSRRHTTTIQANLSINDLAGNYVPCQNYFGTNIRLNIVAAFYNRGESTTVKALKNKS